MRDYIDSTDYADVGRLKHCYALYPYLESNAADGNMMASDLKMDLDRGLECLNEEERAVMVLRFIRGYTIRMCADRLEKSIKWVRSREERAIFKISHYLLTGMELSTSQAKKEILELKKEKEEEDEQV
jgi:RNA polymerase sigma factor (sigma-70 family)